MWQYSVHDLHTGDFVGWVEPSGGSWTRRLTGNGSGSFDFQVRADSFGWSAAQTRGLFRVNDRAIAVRWGDFVAFFGFVTGTGYDRDTGVLTVDVSEVRQVLRRRGTAGVYNITDGNLTITARSLRGATRAVIERAQQWTTRWLLPIDPPDDAAGSYSFAFKWYDHLRIDDLLQQFEALGAEIDFQPYVTTLGAVRCRVRVDSVITTGATLMPVSVDHSPVVGLRVNTDGSTQRSGVIVLGKGSEQDMKVAGAADVDDAGSPMVVNHEYVSAKDERRLSVLQELAAADLAANREPVVQWSFSVQLGDEEAAFTPVGVQVGRVLTMNVWGDPFIPDGSHRQRVIAVKGDVGSLMVTPEVQPYGA